MGEKLFEASYRTIAIFGQRGASIDVATKEVLELGVAQSHGFAETDQSRGSVTNVLDGSRPGVPQALLGGFEQIRGQQIEHALQSFIEFQFFSGGRIRRINLGVNLAKQGDLSAQSAQIEQLGFPGIVQISRVVSNFVHPVDKLSFQRWTQIEQVFRELRK